jgi:cytochrome c oxidase cbb3-type subunit III
MKRCLLLLALLVLIACEREHRRFEDGPDASSTKRERLTSLVPGPYTADIKVDNPYGYNAHAISEGKRLFTWYNCVGCHANGGGGMGPRGSAFSPGTTAWAATRTVVEAWARR